MLKDTFLFDLDGTLVDSNKVHEAAYYMALWKYHPRLLNSFSFNEIKGLSTFDAFSKLGITQYLPELVKEKRYQYLQNIHRIKLIPKVPKVLNYLKDKGFNLCVVTGAKKDVVLQILENTGLTQAFDKIITAEDANRNKPFPDLYEKAISMFGFVKSRCIGLEDSKVGFDSCLSAGIDCIYSESDLPIVYEYLCSGTLCG